MILTPSKREQVLPLPVVLISSISKDGIRNVAPWSNVTPILRLLDEVVIASWLKRDTLENIRQTGEFVINVPSTEMIEAVKICSRNYPSHVDEFEEANLSPYPSAKIETPGIEGCIAWMECTLSEEILRDKFSLVIGKVVHLEVNDSFVDLSGAMDLEKAKPLSAILGNQSMRYTYPA